MLLDKGPLPNPGGSTGHASNFIFPVDHSREMTALTLDSVRQYDGARRHHRLRRHRGRAHRGADGGAAPAHVLGHVLGRRAVSLVTPAEVKELVPFIDESVILGGFYSPSVGVVDSLRAGTLMRERAQELGALTVSANTEVLGIDVEDGRVRRVRTTRGDVEAEYVVICCGVWSPRIARMAGASIPLTPAVHQMIDIGPVPRFADAKARSSSRSCATWTRTCTSARTAAGLEVGSYAHRPILHDPDEIPSIEEAALSPTEFPFTEDDFVLQMEHALELMPEIVGDESVGIKYAINGLLSLTPGRPADPGRDARGAAASGRPPRCGSRRARASAAPWPSGWSHGEPEIDLQASDIARFYEHQKSVEHVKGARRRGLQQDLRDRPPGASSGRPTATSACRPSTSASASSARCSTRPPAGSARTGTSPTRGCVEEYGVAGREAEWESRWWSPIINAEHLAMRDRAAMFDLTAFCVFDVLGPGALDCVQRVCRAPDGREASARSSTRRCSRRTAASAPTSRSCGSADEHFRVVTGGAHGMADLKWFADHLPADGTAQIVDLTSSWCTLGLWGPRARDILAGLTGDDVSHEGFPFATCRTIEIGLAARARLAHLLRRRPRLGALRADRAGRAAVGHGRGGRASRTASCPPASASTPPPAGWRSATAPSASSSTASTTWSRPGWRGARSRSRTSSARRRTCASASPTRPRCMCTLTVDDHTASDGRKRYMLGGEPILTRDGEPLVDAQGPPLVRDQRRRRARRSASTS